MEKYISKKINLKNIGSVIDHIVPLAYHILVKVKYSDEGSSNRKLNMQSSIEQFKRDLVNGRQLNFDMGDRSMDPYDNTYEFVCDYVLDDGWHFLWIYLSKTNFDEIVKHYDFKKI